MVSAIDTGVLSFQAFIGNYLDEVCYELIDGQLIDLEPTGPHEQVTGLINRKLNVAIDLLNLPWFIPMKCLIKPLGGNSAIVVIHRSNQIHSPLYSHYLILQLCWYFDGYFPITLPVLTNV
jgi:Uma2 family endonuclease